MERRRWTVRIGGEVHTVEVADLDHPLLAIVDGMPQSIEWNHGRSSFDVAGHRAQVAARTDWRGIGAELVLATLLGLLTGNHAGGSMLSRLGLRVEGGEVQPDSSR